MLEWLLWPMFVRDRTGSGFSILTNATALKKLTSNNFFHCPISLFSIFVTGSIMPWLMIKPSRLSNLVRALSTAFCASEKSPKSPASIRTCSGNRVRSSSIGCFVLATRTTLWDFSSRNPAIAAPIPATNVRYARLVAQPFCSYLSKRL